MVIDRLGYDSSDHPSGTFATCFGSQADIAHQIVQQLRAGSYGIETGGAPSFSRVALAGHSAAGAIVEIEAYSFRDIDALIVMGWADVGASPGAILALVDSALVCLLGGEPAEPGANGSGYAFFGQRPEDFQALELFSADPPVFQAVGRLRNRDPCGDLNSSALALGSNLLHLALLNDIQVPTLLICGNQDEVFPPPACQLQQALLGGTDDLTGIFIEGMGHGLTIERRAPEFRQMLSDWLRARGF